MSNPIYLDYAATTPIEQQVAEKMLACMTKEGTFGNAGSRSHAFGWKADELVDIARAQVADLIGADFREIIFTSGATEANNLAIKGAALFYQSKGKHIVTTQLEHKAVLEPCQALEREGFEVTYLKPSPEGIISPEAVAAACRSDTVLVSLMWVNNEIGTIQPITEVAKVCHAKGILLHVDAAQAAGKLDIDVQSADVDLLSISGHKLYGPKGVGALFVRRRPRVRLVPQTHGGGQERGLRSGTLAVHQIVGLGEACAIAKQNLHKEQCRIAELRAQLWKGLSQLEAIVHNGHPRYCAPHILNVSFEHIEGESLIMGLEGIAVSSGSACTSASLEPSYVLKALGRSDELAHSSIRFSLGRYTTAEEIDQTIARTLETVAHLRAISPLWEMYQDGVDISSVVWQDH